MKLIKTVLQPQISKWVLTRAFSSQMSLENEVIVEKLDGEHAGIAVIGMNRPYAMNSFSKNMFSLFCDAVESLKYDTNLRVLILRSLAPRIFSVGADLKERAKWAPEEVGPLVGRFRRLLFDVQQFDCPTIAALDGVALGGGLEMALGFDMRIAASNAKMGLVETKLAVIPGGGGTQNLARLIGISKANNMKVHSDITTDALNYFKQHADMNPASATQQWKEKQLKIYRYRWTVTEDGFPSLKEAIEIC